jgi:TorA maturation chaperone TorD
MKSKGFKFSPIDGMPLILEGQVIQIEWTSLFIKKNKLGVGPYGSVYHAITLNAKKHVVVKVTRKTGKEKTDF